MNQASFEIYTDNYINQAISFICQHEPKEGYFLGFSGGKDSIVCYHLCKMSGVKFQAYFSCTGIDPPEIYKFIRQHYPEVIWRYPKMSFWEGIKKKGVPFRVSRWCCDVLKKNPTRNIPLKHRILGIRKEESSRRAKRPMIDQYTKNEIIYKPIFEWLEWQIWEFIEKYNLAYPSLYDEGLSRIGCIVCPFINGKNINRHKDRWPKTYKVFEKVVTEWFDCKQVQGTKWERFKSAEEFLEFWYKG